MFPQTVEELRDLIGEANIPKRQREIDALMKMTQEVIEKRGLDYLKKNKAAFLRQWEYVAYVLF